MIKKLKNKFLICLFLLVTVFSVTSSCFASITNENVMSFDSLDLTMDEVFDYISTLEDENGTPFSEIYNLNKYYAIYGVGTNSARFCFTELDDFELLLMYEDDSLYYGTAYNSLEERQMNFSKLDVFYKFSSKSFSYSTEDTVDVCFGCYPSDIENNKLYFLDCGNVKISFETLDNNIFEPIIVNLSHQFQSDTSAKIYFDLNIPNGSVLKYSLSGIELNTDLTAPLELKNPVNYSSATSLIVKPTTKIYWALYSSTGECLKSDVYQVPEYDTVIENADKSIEYELKYSEDYTYAVLSATLKNGEFSDKLVYSQFSSLNTSTGKLEYGYQNFSGSLKITTNGKYYFYALDSLGNVFDTTIVTVSDIFNFQDSDFSYSIENDSSLHGGYKLYITPKVSNWSSKVDIKYNIKLTSGHQLATVNVDTEYPDLSYVDNIFGSYGDDNSVGAPTYFNGRVMSGDIIRIFSPSNNLEDLKGNITFKIYKKSDNSLIFEKTYTLSISAFTTAWLSLIFSVFFALIIATTY